mmetsp:Transcript_9370/g.10679  ORF Transcript_9370/g.10679 Transcript_9370/m.10679 type:complete len:684 (-) Transcript_9370:37-2088(-)
MAEPPSKKIKADMEEKCINTIRILSADTVEKAKSGHPGAPMGCAPMAYSLFCKFMNYNPKNPSWYNRDRFVLSNGHGCALLYSMLHLTGYARPTLDDLKNFRQLDSVTAGHPENILLDGIEVSTGPLGQGISNGVGLALAETHLAAQFNTPDHKIVDNYTYVICGDGCLQEGVSCEASSLAGHWKLGKLIVLYDDNNIQIDGSTDLAFTEDVGKRYESYGWQVLTVENGNTDFDAIEKAIIEARACTDKPTMIKVKTWIGFGSSKENTAKVHGSPLGADDIKKAKERFGFNPEESFVVPEDVKSAMLSCAEKGAETEEKWNKLFEEYKSANPEKAAEFERRMQGKLPEGWESALPSFTPADGAIASRNSSGKVLNALADTIPDLVGGSADLSPSNKTEIKSSHDYQHDSTDGRYLRYGVREHAMSAICNGMAAYGGIIPYCATFLNFAGYALGAIRLSALSDFQVWYVMTHDSIGLGEDGPTHQPIGMLLSCRSIPNFYVFRPADANEVAGSYKAALNLRKSPSLFALSRQNLPCLAGSSIDAVQKGAYQVVPAESPKLVLCGTGSEVSILVDAAEELNKAGITTAVVSMPCWELFDKQPIEYKQSVFPEGAAVLSLEAGSTEGWSKYSHYQLGLTTFGKSAPYKQLYEYFGLTAENVVAKGKGLVAHFENKAVPWLMDNFSF